MAAKIAAKVPRGMRDILPKSMIRRQYVMDVVQEVFEAFGFEPLQTPVIELEQTLTGKYGPDAERLMYNVGHRGGKERLALRYDLSVPLSRVVAQYPDLIKPFKRYQIAPVWRAERPQKGRYREFYQCDIDTVGPTSMLADAEILNVIYEVLIRLGFEQFEIRFNNRKIINGVGQFAGVPEALLGGLYRSIDKLDRIGLEGVRQELRSTGLRDILSPLARARPAQETISALVKALRAEDLEAVRSALGQIELEAEVIEQIVAPLADSEWPVVIPDAVIDRLLDFLQISGSSRDILAQLRAWLADYAEAIEGIAELEEMITYLEALGIPEAFYQVTPAMVRGLAYYTGPIYETVVEKPRIGSITGGGRYDELIGVFLGRSIPATGTSFGIERIIDVMEELEMFPPEVGVTVSQVLVTQFSPDLAVESLKVARDLRQAGLNTELYFEAVSLGKQIRYALKKGIAYIVILGPDEAAAGQVTVRNLALKEQETIPVGEAAGRIQAWQQDRGAVGE